MSEILRLTSAAWSLFHILILFMFFYSPRYSKKKTAIITCATMVPLVLVNALLLALLEQAVYGQLVLFLLVIPSFAFFFFLAKHRDFRFVFTFCLVDTISAELIIISMLLNQYITPESNIVMFAIRILGFPLVEFFVVKKLRKPYFEIQNSVRKGWGTFSLVSVIFYVLILVMTAFPTVITERPNDMPIMLIFMLLMPLMYLNIFQILHHQNRLNTVEREQELWQIQSSHMQKQIASMAEADKRVSCERHDIRHRLQIIDVMLQKGEIKEAREFISSTHETLQAPTGLVYCKNAVLDAVFSFYFKQAQDKDIRIESTLSISEELPADPSELSIVIANALENAIHACERLPQEKRVISCRCIEKPQFMLQIRNPFDGEVRLDAEGFPVTDAKGHGIGIRSIRSFCERNHAQAEFKIEDNLFALRILIQK